MKHSRHLLAVLLAFVATKAIAWNDFGHMVVAEVAYKQLTPAARAKISQLLKLNPNFAQWVNNTASAQDQDEVAFLMAATWPDAIKRMSTYTNDGEHPTGPDAGRNVGYSDKLMHRYWHFIDIPFSPDGTQLVQPVAPNAETQIHEFRNTIASASASDDVKSYDLVWLLHLVGDVHQPLHATSRFDKQQPTGDAGGNRVALCAKPCHDELHAFWDDVLGKSTSPAAAKKYAAKLKPAKPTLASLTDESKWIEESFEAAKISVYVPPIGIGPGPFTVTPGYKAGARQLAKERVALAGARLAAILNESFR